MTNNKFLLVLFALIFACQVCYAKVGLTCNDYLSGNYFVVNYALSSTRPCSVDVGVFFYDSEKKLLTTSTVYSVHGFLGAETSQRIGMDELRAKFSIPISAINQTLKESKNKIGYYQVLACKKGTNEVLAESNWHKITILSQISLSDVKFTYSRNNGGSINISYKTVGSYYDGCDVKVEACVQKGSSFSSRSNDCLCTEIDRIYGVNKEMKLKIPYDKFNSANGKVTVGLRLYQNGEWKNLDKNCTYDMSLFKEPIVVKPETISPPPPPPSSSMKRIALLIGNADYGSGKSLTNPIRDVDALEKKLKSRGFNVIKACNLSKSSTDDAIFAFSKQAKEYDVALLFYSGHGLQSGGDNYMVPIDARINNEASIKYVCFPVNQAIEYMEGSGCPVCIVMLDACRDNPYKTWNKGFGDGLKLNPLLPKGLCVFMATESGRTASDRTDVSPNHSPFVSALLQVLDESNLELTDLLKKVSKKVEKMTNNEQRPVRQNNINDDIYM